MASAMISGLLNKGVYNPENIICTSADDGTGEALAVKTGIHHTNDFEKLLSDSDTVILAIKPQQLADINSELSALCNDKLIISILAGTPINKLSAYFPDAKNIVRAMPNTPGQIGQGVTCFASNSPLAINEKQLVENILGSMGTVFSIDEIHLDAVTALSGSGPAYVFEFIAALRDGGIEAGLEPNLSYQLALQTVIGSAKLLEQTGEPPETLRGRVTSPGGTTLAGLEVLNKFNFHKIIDDTIKAAKKRSIDLSK